MLSAIKTDLSSLYKQYMFEIANEKELKSLERLTLSFLDYAEDMAIENKVMTMSDWINLVDELLKFRRKGILDHAGKISHYDAVKKAYNEYDKYRSIQNIFFYELNINGAYYIPGLSW